MAERPTRRRGGREPGPPLRRHTQMSSFALPFALPFAFLFAFAFAFLFLVASFLAAQAIRPMISAGGRLGRWRYFDVVICRRDRVDG